MVVRTIEEAEHGKNDQKFGKDLKHRSGLRPEEGKSGKMKL